MTADQAWAIWPSYTGTNSSVTNVSYEVAVVFFEERDSSGRMYPEFMEATISRMRLAMSVCMPIRVTAARKSLSGIWTYARLGLPMAWPMMWATSDMVRSR